MKILVVTVAASALLFSCSEKLENGFPFITVSKEGKGPIKTKEYKMSFDEIKVVESISAEIVKSDAEKVVVTAPSNILNDVVVDNDGGELYIHFKPNMNISARNVAVKIFAKDFSKVEANSSADITIKDKFTQDKTEIKVSSSASISGNIEANDLSIDASSSGEFSGEIWAVELDSEASSSGDIRISGKAKHADLKASSAGTVDAAKVTAESAETKASSGGTVRLSVTKELKSSANSGGTVEIFKRGNLNILSQDENSGGSVSIR